MLQHRRRLVCESWRAEIDDVAGLARLVRRPAGKPTTAKASATVHISLPPEEPLQCHRCAPALLRVG